MNESLPDIIPPDAQQRALAPADRQPAALATSGAAGDLGAAMLAAVQLGPDGVASLKEIMAMVERREDRAAAAEYHAALARFQAECPPIPKTSTAKFVTNSGTQVEYSFASLDEIARVAGPCAHRHGLSWTFREEIDGNKKKTTCVMRHAAGHVDASAYFIATIAGTPLMSESQKSSGTTTFSMRQALRMALGLTTTDHDNDGADERGAGDGGQPAAVTPDQVTQIEGWLAGTGDADGWRPIMLQFYRVARMEDLPAARFEEVVGKLKAKAGTPAPPALPPKGGPRA